MEDAYFRARNFAAPTLRALDRGDFSRGFPKCRLTIEDKKAALSRVQVPHTAGVRRNPQAQVPEIVR